MADNASIRQRLAEIDEEQAALLTERAHLHRVLADIEEPASNRRTYHRRKPATGQRLSKSDQDDVCDALRGVGAVGF